MDVWGEIPRCSPVIHLMGEGVGEWREGLVGKKLVKTKKTWVGMVEVLGWGCGWVQPPPSLIEVHFRCKYLYPIEVHPWPDEAKCRISVHPKKR